MVIFGYRNPDTKKPTKSSKKPLESHKTFCREDSNKPHREKSNQVEAMNNQSNVTNLTGDHHCSAIHEVSTEWKVCKILAYFLVLSSAISGNLIITIIIFTTKNLRKTVHCFVANMACSDLLFSIFVLPKVISELLLGQQRWFIGGGLGLALCKLVFVFQDVSTAVSIQSLLLIAVDRLGAVVFPFRPLFSTKLCRISIAASWVVALGLHSPDFFTRQLRELQDGLICYVDWELAFGPSSSFETYFISLFILLFVAPIILLIIIYAIIIVKLKQQNCPSHLTISRIERQRRLRQENNVLKMAVAIVVGFGFCTVPFCIYALSFLFVWKNQIPCNAKVFKSVAMFLFYANCAINPCLCLIFGEAYRNRLKDVFCCCKGKQGNTQVNRFHRESCTLWKETRANKLELIELNSVK